MKRYPKDIHLYSIAIAYMLLYIAGVLLSGVWLFLLSQGMEGSILHAVASLIDSPAAKSWHNFIEIATPHLFGMGLSLFVVAHFLLFSTKIPQWWSLRFAVVLFAVMFLDIFAYGPIISGVVVSGWVKLAAVFLFVVLFVVLSGMVAVSLKRVI